MNIFSIVFTLVSFKLSGVPAQQAGAGRLRSLPSSPLDGDVEKRLPLSTEQPPGRRTERYACLIHTNKAAVDSCYSSVGRGQCKDRHGNDYGRANYDRTDTNDLSAFSAEHCAYMCAGKPDGNQNLVGFDFADSIKVCACRFTAGYITDGNTTPGQGNCPRDASNPTSWGTKPCTPDTGVGAIDGSGGDHRSHCYRNNNFREQDNSPTAAPAYWLEGVKCPLGWFKTLFNGGDLYQSRDDAKEACAVGCLAASGCAYADLFFGTSHGSSTYALCHLKTDACGDYASNTHSAYSLFVLPSVSPTPGPTNEPNQTILMEMTLR